MVSERYREPNAGVPPPDHPSYVISVVARMVGVHAQTLRYYERAGLVEPARSGGNIRLYSLRDVQRLLWLKSLMEDLGINLAGAEVIMRMSQRMGELERQVAQLVAQLAALSGAGRPRGGTNGD
jgi:MerR family transcriptional regulator/heat shock protein HspR